MIDKRYYEKLGGFSYLLSGLKRRSVRNRPIFWSMTQ